MTRLLRPRRLPRARGPLARGAALTAILAASALAAPSANAASGPQPTSGCDTTSSCGIQVSKLVTYGGDYSPAPTRTVSIAEPPCLWIPEGDAHAGSQYVIDQEGGHDPGAGAMFNTHEAFLQAQKLLATNPTPPGEWYYLPVNPNASAAGKAECWKLPLYYFATPQTPLPGLPIPPETLRDLAFARLQTVPLNKDPILNPSTSSDANLPTSVQVAFAGPVKVASDGHPYVAVTASIPGGVSATVWAEAETLAIDPGTPAARTFDDSTCSQVHTAQVPGAGTAQVLGSTYDAGRMASIGINGTVDCGVTYHAPGSFGLTASVGWRACWEEIDNITQPPPPPAGCPWGNVPGAGDLAPSTAGPVTVAVREIQTTG
jgi:hypothetical protein